MTAYLYLSAGTVFLTVLVNFIIPEGKLHKSVNFVLRLACIFILVSPVLKVFDLSVSGNEDEIIDYDYICSVYSHNQSAQLEKLIYENLGIECECEVEFIYSDGAFKENGVRVTANFVEEETIDAIQSYLQTLGYININVNEKAD